VAVPANRVRAWNTIWKTFARWRDRGVWQQAMDVLRRRVRRQHGRLPEPSMLMVDRQVTKGGRGGPSATAWMQVACVGWLLTFI
jgi:transposase